MDHLKYVLIFDIESINYLFSTKEIKHFQQLNSPQISFGYKIISVLETNNFILINKDEIRKFSNKNIGFKKIYL